VIEHSVNEQKEVTLNFTPNNDNIEKLRAHVKH